MLVAINAYLPSWVRSHGSLGDEGIQNVSSLNDWPEPSLDDFRLGDKLQEQQGRAGEAFPSPLMIPIVFIVFYKKDGTGKVPRSRLQSQVDQLNRAFSGAEAGRDSGFRFTLFDAVYDENDDYHDSCSLYSYQIAMKKFYSKNPEKYYYVYVCSCTGNLGLSWLPYQTMGGKVMTENHYMLGSIVHWDLLPGGNMLKGRYRQGDILTHETGHHLGLRHIYEGGCVGDESFSDGIADTPRQKGNTIGNCGDRVDTCPGGGSDDVTNYMGIFPDSCRNHFTPGQIAYMQNIVMSMKPTYVRLYGNGNSGNIRVTSAPTRQPSVRGGNGGSGDGNCQWVIKSNPSVKCELPFSARDGTSAKLTFNAPAKTSEFTPFNSNESPDTLWCPFQGVRVYNRKRSNTRRLWGVAVCA